VHDFEGIIMVSINDVYGGFVGSISLNIEMLREFCGARTLEIAPRVGSPLHLASAPGSTFRLPLDRSIAPHVMFNHFYERNTIALIRTIMGARFERATLLDIGANSGLFSRQILGAFPEFRRGFAYEPHPENFHCLQHNIAPFPHAQAYNDGLGREPETLEFHLDPHNAGNYSLTKGAMPQGCEYESISVSIRSARAEAEIWLTAGLPIFYKSDTQGYDELIATSIDDVFWNAVFAGMMELWNIDKPAYSIERLASFLDKFPNKRFLHDLKTPITTSDVLSCRNGANYDHKDLVFWR